MAFHVPEQYRWYNHPTVPSQASDGNNGFFYLQHPTIIGWWIMLMVSDGGGWEHVSVSVAAQGHEQERCPTWDEMCHVKDLCWDAEDCVVQYHPARSQYRNMHQFVLHLWRPIGITIPVPPPIFVGL